MRAHLDDREDLGQTVEHWTSFAYCYGIGGLLFAIPIVLGLKKRVLRLERRRDRELLAMLVAAYLFYFTLQGVWNLLAIASL